VWYCIRAAPTKHKARRIAANVAKPLRHMPAQQSPKLELVQTIVQAKANLGQPARVSNIGNKLLLHFADFAFGVGFYFERMKLGGVQQDQICHARLDTKTNKARRFDMMPPASVSWVEPNKTAYGSRI
jgi:hypothetical protein